MSLRPVFLIGACHLLLALTVEAQDSAVVADQRPFSADSSSWSAGLQAGAESANEAPVALRAVVGFVAGVPSVLLGIGTMSGAPQAMLGLGASIGTLAAAARAGDASPSTTAVEYASSRGPQFERGFRTGYSERLRSRQVKAAVTGGVVGAATGLGFVLWLIAHLD
jgi:hypothetical protein